MIKRIRRAFNIFIRKNKRCYVSLPTSFLLGKIKDVMFLFLYHISVLHFLEAIKQNNESKNMFLNALAKDWDPNGTSCHLALMDNCPNCHMS